jgi:hypothetical protein
MRLRSAKPGRMGLVGFFFLGMLACFLVVACGEKKESGGKVAKQNRAPSVTRVEILPFSPRVGQELKASVQAVDPDGDKVELAYQWEVNGEELEGEEEPSLQSESLRPGDRVVLRVIPFDGKTWGEPMESQPRVMMAPPPPKARVEISPQPALPGDLLQARLVTEPETSEEVRLQCKWKVNGQVVEEGDSMEFSTKGLRRGDKIQAEVEMQIPDQEPLTILSRETVLQNRPPQIISKPPERLEAEGKYRYRVKAMDPDGDRLSFRLEGSPPEGMKINPSTGLLEWDFTDPPQEPVHVDIRVTDGQGGEAQQSFDFLVPQTRES